MDKLNEQRIHKTINLPPVHTQHEYSLDFTVLLRIDFIIVFELTFSSTRLLNANGDDNVMLVTNLSCLLLMCGIKKAQPKKMPSIAALAKRKCRF